MRRLAKTRNGAFLIQPRWPEREVVISETAYERLKAAQIRLNVYGIRLAVTRGVERQGPWFRNDRRIARKIGGWLFRALYPSRSGEIGDIFSPNGHDRDGNAVDLRIVESDKVLSLLPYGVFTPKATIACLQNTHEHALNLVRQALESAGFSIQANVTEAMQIHCDVKDMTDARQTA